MGFGVWGLGFGVWGLGFGVWGLGFGVWGLGFGVWGLGFGVWGSGNVAQRTPCPLRERLGIRGVWFGFLGCLVVIRGPACSTGTSVLGFRVELT